MEATWGSAWASTTHLPPAALPLPSILSLCLSPYYQIPWSPLLTAIPTLTAQPKPNPLPLPSPPVPSQLRPDWA